MVSQFYMASDRIPQFLPKYVYAKPPKGHENRHIALDRRQSNIDRLEPCKKRLKL
jgi:hypothetical protein